MLYVAMTGAQQNMLAQAVNTNNLANINTTGFRADLAVARSQPLYGYGQPSRVYAMTERAGTDFTPGTLNTTGRDLDIAIDGQGWIAVQDANANEAYTRSGNLRLTSTGQLLTGSGFAVLGDGGVISVPPANKIEINNEATITIVPAGGTSVSLVVVDRIKLVNPPAGDLYKGADGLIRLKDGRQAEAEANVKIVPGTLESSNVNAVEALVNMIELARQFEMQIKMMQLAEQNDERTVKLMDLA